MKIQCSCGAKYAFDLSPDLAQRPVQLICQACGLDLSQPANDLIRQELAQAGGVSPAPQPLPTVRVRIHQRESAPEPVAPQPAEAEEICPKHPDQLATDRCFVCAKPICPKCMELFGYVCSPLCKAKANSHGLQVPVYSGQRSLVEARLWRWTGRAAWAAVLAVMAAIGVWIWYAWFGCLPKPVFAVRFADVAYSGQSCFCGQDQIVLLHGDTLARYDMKSKKEIWSRRLIDPEQIQAAVNKEIKERQEVIKRATENAWSHIPRMPS